MCIRKPTALRQSNTASGNTDTRLKKNLSSKTNQLLTITSSQQDPFEAGHFLCVPAVSAVEQDSISEHRQHRLTTVRCLLGRNTRMVLLVLDVSEILPSSDARRWYPNCCTMVGEMQLGPSNTESFSPNPLLMVFQAPWMCSIVAAWGGWGWSGKWFWLFGVF